MRSSLLFGLALFIAATPALANETKAPSIDLAGLWGSEQPGPSLAQGVLIVDGRAPDWTAHVSGYSVPVGRKEQGLSFSLPDHRGEFEGTLRTDGSISGFWLQSGRSAGRMGFISPVRLQTVSPGIFEGSIEPLPYNLSLYLVVRPVPDGTVTAFIRNPEQNFAAHRLFDVAVIANDVVLTNVKDKSDRITGRYDAAARHLALSIPMRVGDNHRYPVTFEFTRRDKTAAPGFYPRTPPEAAYHHTQPIEDDDGWRTATFSDVDMDPRPVEDAVKKVLTTETADSDTPYIQGILIAHKGRLVLDEYFYGFDHDVPHDLRSTGKSFTSAMVGAAILNGVHLGLDTPVIGLFPEYPELKTSDDRKLRITVRHLLTMTSGLACDDAVDASPGNEDTMFSQMSQPDYYRFILDLPDIREPGESLMHYCTGGINLLGGVLRNVTGRSYADLFETYLAEPLQFRKYYLASQPTKEAYGGGGLYVRPRDMIKLGQVYLDHGIWNGRRIVSSEWVELSTQRWSGYSPEHGYGFAWHLFSIAVDGRSYREYEAQGNGGQLIMVVPELDLVVGCVTGNYGDDETVAERGILSAAISSIARAS